MRLEEAGQQRLELESQAPDLLPEMESGVRSVKSCTQPVASPLHRLTAAAVDAGIVTIAFGVFAGLSVWLGGAQAMTSLPIMIWGAVGAGIVLLYKSLWWLADSESPGMAWCGLQVLSFTGQEPTRFQRAKRFFGSVLSLSAAGLGLLWCLGDEEQLGWNDYLSKTFPTPREQ
jgi:uncharacterized RDD family membrane protein YckC